VISENAHVSIKLFLTLRFNLQVFTYTLLFQTQRFIVYTVLIHP